MMAMAREARLRQSTEERLKQKSTASDNEDGAMKNLKESERFWDEQVEHKNEAQRWKKVDIP